MTPCSVSPCMCIRLSVCFVVYLHRFGKRTVLKKKKEKKTTPQAAGVRFIRGNQYASVNVLTAFTPG